MKTKSDCAPDGSVMLVNDFPSRIVIILYWNMFELYFVSNYFHFFIHLFVHNDVMFYTID